MFHPSYDMTVIKHAIAQYIQYKSFRKAAMHCAVSKSSIHRWWMKVGRINQRREKRFKRGRRRAYDHLKDQIEALLGDTGFVTLESLRMSPTDADPNKAIPSTSTLSRTLKLLKFRRKRVKSHVTYTKPDVLEGKIRDFQAKIKDIPLEEMVSIDETGFATHANVFYKYTRGTGDEKFEVPKRDSRSCVLAVTTSGLLNAESFNIKKGAFNTDSFVAFMTSFLEHLPAQYRYVVMDNINFHHSKRVTAVLEQYGRVAIFTPPYSPRFNPIENVFSVLKRLFRHEFLKTRLLEHSIDVALHKYRLKHNDILSTFEHGIHCEN